MLLPLELLAFLIGLLLGSFLNVCITRLPLHESIVTPRSHCPRCLQPIRLYDNIPLLSWILLRARCRSCRASIPWRYPLVELAVALWAVLAVRLYILTAERGAAFATATIPATVTTFSIPTLIAIAGVFILGFLLIGLMVMDWQTHTLADAFTLPGIAIGFALACARAGFLGPHEDEVILNGRDPINAAGSAGHDLGNVVLTGPEHYILSRLAAILLAFALIVGLRALYKRIRHQEGLGLGDAKLMAMLAAFLGFWPAMLAMFLGVLACAVYAASLLANKRADRHTAVPLGAFLCAGGLFAAIASAPLLTWYASFF
jgi:leader peptidase (prepilin peptidase)/N-methyltransferase